MSYPNAISAVGVYGCSEADSAMNQQFLNLGAVRYDYPQYLSPSSISTFAQCPLKFRFYKLDRLPTESTEAQHLGNFVHEILESLFRLPRHERSEATARTVARSLWDDRWSHKFLELKEAGDGKQFRWKAWSCVENYFSMEDPTSFDADGIEAKVDGTVDGVPLYGIVDRYTIENGKLVVSDYKTGKKPKRQYEWDKKMQLAVYCLLLQEQTGLEVERAELLYVKTGEFARYEMDDEVTDAVRVEVRRTWDQMTAMCDSGEFETRTGPLCGWCDFQPVCPEFG